MKASVLHILEATTGGTRRHLVDLVTHLDPSRYVVSVVCSTLRDPSFSADIEWMRSRGVDVSVVQMHRAIRPLSDLVAFFRIRRILKRGYDIVHTHSSKAGFLGRLAATTVGTPFVVHTPHVFPFQMITGFALKRLYTALERLAARWTDILICVSPEEKQAAQALGLLDESRLRLIENGVTVPPAEAAPSAGSDDARKRFGIAAGVRVIGTVGRCTRQKGHEYLIRAAAAVTAQRDDTLFVILGDGKSRASEEARVKRLGLADRIRFLDPRDDPGPFFNAIDIFVMPSLWEGLPYALLEAMGHGIAVVATRVGGMEQAIANGVSGLLVPPGDTSALAGAIVGLLDDPERRAALGVEARATVLERFLLEDMTAKVEAVYQAGLDNRGQNH